MGDQRTDAIHDHDLHLVRTRNLINKPGKSLKFDLPGDVKALCRDGVGNG